MPEAKDQDDIDVEPNFVNKMFKLLLHIVFDVRMIKQGLL